MSESAQTTGSTAGTALGSIFSDNQISIVVAVLVGLLTVIIVASLTPKKSEKKETPMVKSEKNGTVTTGSKKGKKKSKGAKASSSTLLAVKEEKKIAVEENSTPEPSGKGKKNKKKKKGAASAAEESTSPTEIASKEIPTPSLSDEAVTTISKNKKKKNKKNKIVPVSNTSAAVSTVKMNKVTDDDDEDSDDEMEQAARLLAMKQKGKGKTNAVATSNTNNKQTSTSAKPVTKQSPAVTTTSREQDQQQAPPEVLLDIGSDPAILIGPGGSTIQTITATSGARLDILKNTPGHGQNRVRITSGNSTLGRDPATCIATAVEMVQTLLDEQAAILAKSKTVTLISSDINGQAGVKAIIGRSGQTIQGILEKCNGTNGSMTSSAQSVKINANIQEETVEITGPKDLVDKAVKLCKQAVFGEIQNAMKIPTRSAMNVILGGKDYRTIQHLQISTGAKLDMDKERLTLNISGKREEVDAAQMAVTDLLHRCKGVTMQIKASDVGAVYGKGGSTIRSVQDATGAFLEVQQQSNVDSPALCVIMGEPDAVAQARELVTKAMSREVEIKPGEVADNLSLGGAATAAVIGKGGSKIKELENVHNVTLTIKSDSDVCRIVGKESNVRAAKQAIQTIVEPILAAEEAQKQATLAAEAGGSAWQGYDIPPDEEGW